MNDTLTYAIGLMSGTSMDGVDGVCVRLNANHFDGVIAHAYVPFSNSLRHDLLALQDIGNNELHRSRLLAQTLTEIYVEVIEELFRLPEMAGINVAVVGCHGQTVRHAPQAGYSIQLADWALLAEKIRLPVVGDFRAADIAASGQGAPLVPAFHHMLFAVPGQTHVIVNLGGIANLTVLAGNGAITGFDVGPGNMLMDAWMRQHFARAYDENGTVARSGKVLPELLVRLLDDAYFRKKPPKSTGRDDFSFQWLSQRLHGNEAASDVLRTLLEVTAQSIVTAIRDYAEDAPLLLLCGGGAANTFLRERLAELLPTVKVNDTASYGLPPTYVEAAAFAWLAYCRLHHLPANLPAVSGAHGVRVLGALWEGVLSSRFQAA